ncbi:MAG: nucleotidyltransferase family protein [Bacteroidales bacterium]|jgi:hypothetical protein
MVFTQTEDRLLFLVSGALKGAVNESPDTLFSSMSHSDWNELLDTAARHGVTALATDGMVAGVKELVPKDIWLRWYLSVEKIERRYQRQLSVLEELKSIFSDEQIEVLVLKGATLSVLYPVSEHRECGDIDIFLFGNYARGNGIIEKMGIKVTRTGLKHSSFYYKGVPVENHKTLLNVAGNRFDRNLERHMQMMIKEGKIEDFHLLFNIRHIIVHFLSKGIVLRHLTDHYLLLKSYSGNAECAARLPEIFKILKEERQLYLFTGLVRLISECLGEIGIEKHILDFYSASGIEPPDQGVVKRIYEDTFVNITKRRDISKIEQMNVLKRKIRGAEYMIDIKWKYDLIERGYFGRAFLKHVGYAFKIFKTDGSL